MNKYDLHEQTEEALFEAIKWHVKEYEELPTIDDLDLHELADGLVPVYTSDLLDLLQSDYGTFGWVDSEMGEVESVDDIVTWNAYHYINEYIHEIFDDVLSEVQEPIELCMTDNIRIIVGGKNVQYCPEDRLLDLREEYIAGTGENISEDDWLDCWEDCSLDELEDATADQINFLEQDDNGNWVVI